MTRANTLNIAGKTAIIAALMGGSSLAYAQDSVPLPVEPAPVAETVITPPPAVSTLPTANDTVNPGAAAEAAAETESRSAAVSPAAVMPKSPAVTRNEVAARTASAPTAGTSASDSAIGATVDNAPLSDNVVEPVDATVEDTAVIAPIVDSSGEADSLSNEDLTLFGGLAAALAAIGLGAAFASRRRRRVVAPSPVEAATAAPLHTAPRPISEDPAFQQFPARTAPIIAAPVVPVAERVIRAKPAISRFDVPVTDPLFAPRNAPEIPVTDPLFSHKTEVPPVTDPMFAHLAEYEGNGADRKGAWSFDARRNWADTRSPGEVAPRELEPAE